jgi:hypothetical protein
MIYLSGSINLMSQQELQREAELFSRNGWELRDPTTHRVSVTIAQEDIDAFCDYLRNRPADRKPKVWRDRNGEEHQASTVTFFLNGSEMTGSWTRLRARLDPSAQPRQSDTTTTTAARPAPHPPVRRAPDPSRNNSHVPAAPPSAQPAQPAAWQAEAFDDDDDIPF